jgi:hypothetical protein
VVSSGTQLSLMYTPIPEPALGLGVFTLFAAARRSRRRPAHTARATPTAPAPSR